MYSTSTSLHMYYAICMMQNEHGIYVIMYTSICTMSLYNVHMYMYNIKCTLHMCMLKIAHM